MDELKIKLANALGEKPEHITDIATADGYVDFKVDGVWYYAQVTKKLGLRPNTVRRAS
jgi:hypothetical protein